MIDHTGYIKYTEFIAACLDARDYTEESAVHEAFHRLDVNRSGGITRENMIALLKDQLIMEIKDQSVEDVVDEMFRTGDKDGTGEINISDLKAILEEDDWRMMEILTGERRATMACQGVHKLRIVKHQKMRRV